MLAVWRRLKEEGLAGKLILQVHDELIVECPAAEETASQRFWKKKWNMWQS